MFGIVTVSLAMPHHVVKNERIVCDVIFKNMAFLFCLFAFFRVSNCRGKTLGHLMLPPQTLPKLMRLLSSAHITFLAFRMVSSFILLHVRKHN